MSAGDEFHQALTGVLEWDADYCRLTEAQAARWQQLDAESERLPVAGGCVDVSSIATVDVEQLYTAKLALPSEALHYPSAGDSTAGDDLQLPHPPSALYPVRPDLNAKISVWRGNIVHLRIGAIVNAANTGLLGGGGIDGAIGRAGGPGLYEERKMLVRPGTTGKTKITRGYELPADYVLHTVGPIGKQPALLLSCYDSCLRLARQHGIRTIGFCGVSTGVYGYPLTDACPLVLHFVRRWLHDPDNAAAVDRLVFVCFNDVELQVYQQNVPFFFPV